MSQKKSLKSILRVFKFNKSNKERDIREEQQSQRDKMKHSAAVNKNGDGAEIQADDTNDASSRRQPRLRPYDEVSDALLEENRCKIRPPRDHDYHEFDLDPSSAISTKIVDGKNELVDRSSSVDPQPPPPISVVSKDNRVKRPLRRHDYDEVDLDAMVQEVKVIKDDKSGSSEVSSNAHLKHPVSNEFPVKRAPRRHDYDEVDLQRTLSKVGKKPALVGGASPDD